MSIRIKKKSKLYRLAEDAKLVDSIIFGYLGGEFLNLLTLDKIIYQTIISRIRIHISQTIKAFALAYKDNFTVLSERTKNIKITKTSKGEAKLNIPIYFSVQKLIKQTRYCLSYSYEINRKGKTKKCAWNSQFYVCGEMNRTIWIYKQSHNYSDLPSYPMDVMPVRKDDILCVVLPFYNFGKLISKLSFYPLTINQNLSFECQVQKMHTWSLENKFSKTMDFQVEDIIQGRPEHFKTKSVKYSNIQNYYRLELQCIRPFQYTKLLDFAIQAVSNSSPTLVSLKKKGCYNDESNKLQLRQDDNMIIYFMKS